MILLIEQVIRTEAFKDRVKSEICRLLIDTQCEVYDQTEGMVTATISEYEFEDGPAFGQPQGDALEWDIPLTATGSATRGYITGGEQADRSDTSDPRNCEGTIHVIFPPDTIASSSINEITDSLDIKVTVDSANLNDREPEQEPEIE